MDAGALPWWLWLAAGLVLIGAEVLVTPGGLYLIFFGVSALVVGLLALTGAVVDPGAQLLLFALVSAVDLLLFRRVLAERFRLSGGTVAAGELVGVTAVALEPVQSSQVGTAELHGAIWRVRNVGKFDLAQGQPCRVERVEGLELWVRPI